MDSREPAGMERGKGKSAEPFMRARMGGGAVGNTHGTVRGRTAGALSAYRNSTPFPGVNGLSVGACLYRLFI